MVAARADPTNGRRVRRPFTAAMQGNPEMQYLFIDTS
jgi:hypothetical protein